VNRFSQYIVTVRNVLRVALLTLAQLWLLSTASAQLVLYDNFSKKTIDPTKWEGWQDTDTTLRETIRELTPTPRNYDDNRLHLSQRVYSAVTDDNGGSGGAWGLKFPNPAAITTISFTVAVNRANVTACSTNSDLNVTNAEFRGNFFNVQSSATSSIGDVLAEIGINRYATDTSTSLTVSGFVNECADQFCGSQTNLAYQELGTVSLGSTNTLSLQWDQPNHRFIFRLNNGNPVFESYSVPDTNPPFFAYKGIDLARVVPDCTGTPRPSAFIDAYFDNVYVNP
jgi:hypothetical protein